MKITLEIRPREDEHYISPDYVLNAEGDTVEEEIRLFNGNKIV